MKKNRQYRERTKKFKTCKENENQEKRKIKEKRKWSNYIKK